jgi:sortase A
VTNKIVFFSWLCIAAGLGLLVYIFSPIVSTEITYRTTTQPKTIIPVDKQLGIIIPKIGANAKIIAHVDPNNSEEYQRALTQGVAHAKGTALPGDPGNSFLFSHSSANLFLATTYNSIFYLLNKLDIGDPILIFREGNMVTFSVTEKKIVSSKDISVMSTLSPEPQLTLMTCWPPGTDFSRLLIIAKPLLTNQP